MEDFAGYFEDELRILTEEGREFARAFPEKSRGLNLSDADDRDPYVERLFEGFAFLTGRIRQMLDDGFPQITENVLDMIAPDFLRPFPSCAMIQFQHRPGMLRESFMLEKGTLILSNPAGPDQAVCRFQTSCDVVIHPLVLTGAAAIHHPSKGSGLVFSFRLEDDGQINPALSPRLPLYLHGDRAFAWRLHYLLTKKVKSFAVTIKGGQVICRTGADNPFQPCGFGERESILPVSHSSSVCGSLLREFFLFEEKFRSVEFRSLDFTNALLGVKTFDVQVFFVDPLPPEFSVSAHNFKLNAVPAVNLYNHQAEPIRSNQRQFEYQLRPSGSNAREIYDVMKVEGVEKHSGRRKEYARFSSFRHAAAAGESSLYYQLRRESKGGGASRFFISPGGRYGSVESLCDETLSIVISATDGGVPRKDLLEGDICNPGSGFPGFIRFSNFTRPSPPAGPPAGHHTLWTVLSHFNWNFETLCKKENFIQLLTLYNWKQNESSRKLIQGITNAGYKIKRFMIDGQVVSGTEVVIWFKDDAFSGEGEKNIFGEVLLHFISQYASINYLVGLRLVSEPSGSCLLWNPVFGKCLPL